MDIDGITISTTAITALLGTGGIGVVIGNAVRRKSDAKKCQECSQHKDHEERLRKLETETAAHIAEIKADIRNICRSLDEVKEKL